MNAISFSFKLITNMKGIFYVQMRPKKIEQEWTIFTVYEWEQRILWFAHFQDLMRMTKKWPRNDHEMTKKWPRNDQEMTKKWPRNDQEMTKKWPRNDQEMTTKWPRND
jgi:hypothetical protein